ncbi:MAG: hypothetical protein DCC46_02555 [Armatimonadetes bacterium]|nr:MAG: hypothetical protein DCC46_02555 [Armatimonadota bacterium]
MDLDTLLDGRGPLQRICLLPPHHNEHCVRDVRRNVSGYEGGFRMKRKLSGFTIVEVMVVVAIIAILVTILMPVLQGARKSSSKVVCASNMHQIYAAMKLYEADYGDYPPGSVVWPAFQPYYPTVLICPAGTLSPRGEFDYIMAGNPLDLLPGYNEALRECKYIRGGLFPVVRDHNHMVKTNAMHPESWLYLVRENGAFSVVRPKLLDGPCKSIVGFDSNL